VCGIAAGDDPVFGGIATKADIVVVKTNFTDVGIADGVDYVFRIARERGCPAVVNLSLGGHSDAHDGSDELSERINAAVGPGRIVCCAAGNEGDESIHAQTTIQPGQSSSVRFTVSPGSSGLFLNGWCAGARGLRVAVISAQGPKTSAVDVAGANTESTQALPGASVDFLSPNAGAGDVNFDIVLTPQGAASLPPGTWRLQLTNTSTTAARVDLWIADTEPSAAFTGTSVSRDMLVGSPGAAAGALTVGAFVTKTHWTPSNGVEVSSGFHDDTICSFSSPGPLRNGSPKPDVTAPGSIIISALSRFSSPQVEFIIDDFHVAMQGTSMATPFMTGLVACLLEQDHNLDPQHLKAMLRENSRIPGKPPATFDAKWGFGLVDAANI
jgi:subtilisin family serine protease